MKEQIRGIKIRTPDVRIRGDARLLIGLVLATLSYDPVLASDLVIHGSVLGTGDMLWHARAYKSCQKPLELNKLDKGCYQHPSPRE
jgi:hypothetical protein